MAATSKFDPSSDSPDRATYPGGQRGAYGAASSSGGYREGMDNRILSALPSMSRSTTTLSQGDVLNFFNGLPFDSQQLAVNHKLPRQEDLSRVMTATLGISPGDLPSSSLDNKQLPASSLEELKRVKTNLQDNSVRARDRAKIMNETTSQFDKCFDNILRRKRPRSDVTSSDRMNSSLSMDRTVFGGIAKGIQNQTSSYDTETPKLEEKTKNIIPNKRTRTSLSDVQMDVRANVLARSHGSMERDRDILGIPNAVQSEEKDRILSSGIDGWEKSRMKKKRSGIKSEMSTSTVLNRPLEGDQECKRDMQQRLGTDVRSRSSNGHGFRTNGVGNVGKLDLGSQKAGIGMRSIPKNDQDNSSHLNDRRDHLLGSDKERVNMKAFNRSNIREINNSSGPSSTTKMNTVTRAPRSGPGAIPKASSNVHRSVGVADGWEPSPSLNKLHPVTGGNNRKRTPSARSASPPVAQWAGQRPQKIPRVARRSSFVSPSLGRDETPILETESTLSGNSNGLGFQRRPTANTLKQVKVKGDQFLSAALSESEESAAAEIKSKNKSRKSGEVDDKGGQNVPKVVTQVVPLRKNKMLDEGLGLGGGVRRQGRTIRGLASTRSGNQISVEKRENAVTAKQLRSSRLGFDRIESKTGRPPTKKLSDRRAYTRPRNSINAGIPDFHGESDDGRDELLAAANAAVKSGHACSSTFWRQLDPYFGFVTSEDIAYLKQQGDCSSTPTPAPACRDDSAELADGFGLVENECDQTFTNEAKSIEHLSDQLAPGKGVHGVPSSFQRLLSAFIVEEGDEGFCSGQEESEFEPKLELKGDTWSERALGNIQTIGRPASNGYRITATRRYLDELDTDDLECADIIGGTTVETITNFENSQNGLQPNQSRMPSVACTQSQYDQMSIHERIHLELQSIGIFPEPVREDEDISDDISRLEEKLHGQVLKKEQLLRMLEKSVTEAREIQERDIERRAYDKLVGMAYEKYMACWGPNASCGKGMSAKIAKQAVLVFVKRTIDRCQKFENTSESCFNDATFMDVFHSVSSFQKIADSFTNKDGDSLKLYADIPIRSSEVTVSESLGTHPFPSRISLPVDSPKMYSSDSIQLGNHLPEQIMEKQDVSSNRMKKRELLLDDVVGGLVGTSLRGPLGVGSSLVSGAKGKRSERDREGKGKTREMQSRNGTAKIGRPSVGNAKGERKSKAKPKQRLAQLSTSVNDLVKTPEIPKEVLPSALESRETMTIRDEHDDLCLDKMPDSEAIDLSHLQLPEMDVLAGPYGNDEQGQDLGLFFGMEDDGFQDQDHNLVGLDIPMDDLSEVF